MRFATNNSSRAHGLPVELIFVFTMETTVDKLDQKAAAQLDVEIIPGTEVMKDVGDVHFAHAGGSERGSV